MKLIKINYLTYYLLLIYFLCGLIKPGIIVFIIIIFHELGHVFIAKINKYEILSINIYPFGGITKIKKDINSPFLKDLFLSLGGFIFQIILYFIFNKLNSIHLITNNTFDIFCLYNKLILLFNLLPIIPLDGSQIAELLLSKVFPFKKSLLLNICVSLSTLFLFVLFNYNYSLNNYLIITFLFFKILENKKNISLVYNKFLLERCLNYYEFKHIISNHKNKISNIKKYKKFYFWNNNHWEDEKIILQNKFFK